MYTTTIGKIDMSKMGFYITKRPSFPSPIERVNEIDVKGRDGKLYQHTGLYDDIVLLVEYNYMSSVSNWHNDFRKAKSVLLNAHGSTIGFSDENKGYWKIKRVTIDNNERTSKRIGKFTVQFTLSPYFYLKTGNKKISIVDKKEIFNQYLSSQPIYVVRGEGVCYLEVNGNKTKINVGQHIIIDTEKMISYRDNGEFENTNILTNYTDLYLKNGNNYISITNGFSVELTPRWRCL